jgi:hypothetical protein
VRNSPRLLACDRNILRAPPAEATRGEGIPRKLKSSRICGAAHGKQINEVLSCEASEHRSL